MARNLDFSVGPAWLSLFVRVYWNNLLSVCGLGHFFDPPYYEQLYSTGTYKTRAILKERINSDDLIIRFLSLNFLLQLRQGSSL